MKKSEKTSSVIRRLDTCNSKKYHRCYSVDLSDKKGFIFRGVLPNDANPTNRDEDRSENNPYRECQVCVLAALSPKDYDFDCRKVMGMRSAENSARRKLCKTVITEVKNSDDFKTRNVTDTCEAIKFCQTSFQKCMNIHYCSEDESSGAKPSSSSTSTKQSDGFDALLNAELKDRWMTLMPVLSSKTLELGDGTSTKMPDLELPSVAYVVFKGHSPRISSLSIFISLFHTQKHTHTHTHTPHMRTHFRSPLLPTQT